MKKTRKYNLKFVKLVLVIIGILAVILPVVFHVIVRISDKASSNDFTSAMIAHQAKERVNKFLEGDIEAFVYDMYKVNDGSEKHIENYEDFLDDVKKI